MLQFQPVFIATHRVASLLQTQTVLLQKFLINELLIKIWFCMGHTFTWFCINCPTVILLFQLAVYTKEIEI